MEEVEDDRVSRGPAASPPWPTPPLMLTALAPDSREAAKTLGSGRESSAHGALHEHRKASQGRDGQPPEADG